MRFLTKEYRMCVIIYKKMKINSIVRWYVYLLMMWERQKEFLNLKKEDLKCACKKKVCGCTKTRVCDIITFVCHILK
jgi:hypothetical protein